MKKLIYVMFAFILFNTGYLIYIQNNTKKEFVKVHAKIDNQSIKVTATMYNAVESQCDADPLITAGMYKINPNKASEHKWIAVSRDLLKRWKGKFNYGDKVQITGAGHKDGVYTITDTMNKRFTKRIDILETSGTRLYKFNNVTLTKI